MIQKVTETMESQSDNSNVEGSNISTNLATVRDILSISLRSNKRQEHKYRTSFRVTLDDSVDALADLKMDYGDHQNNPSHPKTLGSLLDKRVYGETSCVPDKSYSQQPHSRAIIPNGQGPK